MEKRLVFLVSAPRSGSTLLARMLSSHSAVAGGPEPHLLTPLAHLGYFARVDTAPYDPIISQEGIRELVARLPGGEQDYVDACRAYTDRLYEGYLATSPGCKRVLDKTPAYALVLPFLARLYPRARYVVLTRNPLAVLVSYATSFFDSDYAFAVRHNPILRRYVPAIARFLREPPEHSVHLRYEDLVERPEAEIRRVCEALELPFESSMLEYGSAEVQAAPVTGARGLGDPTGVSRHTRPVTDSILEWATELAQDPGHREIALGELDALDPRDLEAWGYTRAGVLADLESASPSVPSRRRPLSRYRLERKLLVLLRRVARAAPLERLLRRVRYYCDVLLR
jgi:hypothetical protein